LGRLLALSSPSFADDLRLLLDGHHDAQRAFDAAQDLARALQLERASFGDLWSSELQALMQQLRNGQLDPPAQADLLDGLTGLGLSRDTAQAIVSAFQEATGDTDLSDRLARLGFSALEVTDLLAISHGAQTPGRARSGRRR